MKTVLITGIGGRLARRIARGLIAQVGARVIAVDRVLPDRPLQGIELHQSDMQGRALLPLLRSAGVDAVVHLAQIGEEQPYTDRETALQANVLTTTELLGACLSAGVRRVVLRSSTLVYGAHQSAPAFFSEDAPLLTNRRGSLLGDYLEVEHFVARFASAHPELEIVTLRCAGLVGGKVSAPLARYLSQPAPCTMLGFNPRMQVLHPNDAALAFGLAAILDNVTGPFNIAISEPLTIHRIIRLAGHHALPLPGPLLDIAGVFGTTRQLLPFDPAFLRYSCVADTRRAHRMLGWIPQYSAEIALRELISAQTVPADVSA